MMTFIWTIVIFCVLIAVHEFGHFITAKLSGVTVFEFAIGMGPKIFGFEKGGTKYTLRLLPIGGYCQMAGEDGKSDDKNALCNKNGFQRFLVLFSGAGMNFILGFLIFLGIFSFSAPLISNGIGEITNGYAFQQAGFQAGDRIVYMVGENYSAKIGNYNDINYFKFKNGNTPVTVTVERNGEKISKYIVPTEENGGFYYGFTPATEVRTVFNVLKYAFDESIYVAKLVISSIVWLITGNVSVSDMAGPVGIINEINTAAQLGITSVLSLAALISINLGVANLLPIPALDGGRILFLIIEKIRRKPLPENAEGLINMIGFALLMLLMVLVTFSDIRRIFF